jgi:hypothetical protein
MIAPYPTEADVLLDVVQPKVGSLPPAAAEFFIELEFSQRAKDRMSQLCDRGNQGELTPQERAEIEAYRRVGMLLDLLQAKARLSLRQSNHSGE